MRSDALKDAIKGEAGYLGRNERNDMPCSPAMCSLCAMKGIPSERREHHSYKTSVRIFLPFFSFLHRCSCRRSRDATSPPRSPSRSLSLVAFC